MPNLGSPLAGPGIGGGYSTSSIRKVTAVASPTALAIGSDNITRNDGFVEYDVTNAPGGSFASHLPGAVNCNGMIVVLKRLDASGNSLTFTDVGGATIDGSASLSLSGQYSTVELQSDGVQWVIRSASQGVLSTTSNPATPSGPAGGDLGGTYPNPTVSKITNALTSYGGDTLVGNGLSAIVAKVDLATQNANISTTTLYAVPANEGGMYRASCYAVETTADGASSTLPNIGVGWTDADSSVALSAGNVTPTNTANAAGAFGQGSQIVYAKGGTNITYQTSNYASGTAGAMKYSVHIKLEKLG
jgi:hypothetical protein